MQTPKRAAAGRVRTSPAGSHREALLYSLSLTRPRSPPFPSPPPPSSPSPRETLANFDVVHRMCNQRPPHNFTEQLYNRHNEMYKGHLTTVYNRVKGLTGLELLRTLEKVWADQVLMTRWTTKFFAYLNR